MSTDPPEPDGTARSGGVVLRGHLQVPPEDVAAVRAALPEHTERSRAEPGCLRFEVTPDPTDPCRFEVFECFVDRAALDAHQARLRASVWGRVSRNAIRRYTVRD